VRRLFSLVIFFSVGYLSANESVVYDISSLSATGQIELIGGKTVKLPLSWAPGTRVVFEDLHPGANWGHPAKIRVLSENGRILQEIETELPPAFLKALPILSGKSRVPKAAPIFDIKNNDGKQRVGDPDKYYALLINGHADQRHWNDFSFLYRVLTKVYGYHKANIFVADSAFKSQLPDLDGDGVGDIQYGSTLEELKELISLLKDKLPENAHLVLAVNDHGSRKAQESTIILYDAEITASEFTKLLGSLPAKKVLSIYEQCFSGGFVRPSSERGRVAMAASTDTEFSWASMDLNFDEFIYHVIVAFAQQTHEGKAVKSDLNQDGKISAQEAFTYAIGNDKRKESPILEAHRNSGESAKIGFGF